MPILKVSKDLERIAKEVIRIQITVLGDCPQCQGTNYRSGVCEDCAFISPEVMEAIKEWQEAQAIGPQGKAASRFAFTDILPSGADISRDFECPKCGRKGFDIQCENAQCGYEQPPRDLNHRDPEYTGVSPELAGTIRRKFLSPGGKIEEHKKRLKKRKTKKVKKSFKAPEVKPGTSLDDSTIVSTDAKSKTDQAVAQMAQEDYKAKLLGEQNSPEDK